MATHGECALCRRQRDLCGSHILPAFVFRWQKKTSVGHLRQVSEPNRRVQDGWKEPLLCRECEELLQKVETPFAEQVFVPVHEGTADPRIPYEEWALRFAVSVSWRVLVSFLRIGVKHFSKSQLAALDHAEQTWREFLLGEVPDPGEHEQHVMFLDLIKDSKMGNQSASLNTYFYRAVQVDLLSDDDVSFVYAKMGRILVVGFINEPGRNKWKGTKVHLKRGVFDLEQDRAVPKWLFSYWNEQADAAGGVHDKMSEKQRKVVRETLKKRASEYRASETWLARQVDLGLDPDAQENP